jgi:NAD(P)-dependent dehydrogenase (short-subunit alcohol dehydrogenase family)
VVVGKLEGKVAVITGATSGMALAGAKLFVDEGAHVFISGRRKDALDQAVKLIGRDVTGVQADSADLDDLDRLFETVKQEKGTVDVLWASAGMGEQGKLDGKVAVVAGATSGMALAGAKSFVDEGAHVFISGRHKDALDEAVQLIGRNVTGVQADSADLDDLDRLFDTVKREKGTVDVLWASAGMGEQGRLGDITEEQFDAAFSLNARGTLFTVQKALPLFNDGGSIFMTGSNASLRGYPNWGVYAASKAVLPAYARVWVSELRDRKIRVNVLTPGQVATPVLEQVMDEQMKAQFESVIPRRKMGRPEEIASAALFLASDDSSYVNGMELVVDGGTTVI